MVTMTHSSEIRVLFLMKLSSEMLQIFCLVYIQGFLLLQIWQILKRFTTRQYHQALTSYFWRVDEDDDDDDDDFSFSGIHDEITMDQELLHPSGRGFAI